MKEFSIVCRECGCVDVFRLHRLCNACWKKKKNKKFMNDPEYLAAVERVNRSKEKIPEGNSDFIPEWLNEFFENAKV